MSEGTVLTRFFARLGLKGTSNGIVPRSVRARWAFRGSVRTRFYKHLISQNSNGVALTRCVESYRDRLERNRERDAASILTAVLGSMHNGFTLDKALQPWVPLEEFGVLVGGVQANALPVALTRLLAVRERTKGVRKEVLSSLAAPAGNFGIAFGFMYFMGKGVLPVFEGLVPREHADSLIRALYDMGDFATGWGLPVFLLVLGAIIGAGLWSLPRWTGRSRIFAEKIFPWSFYRSMQGYLWLMGYSSLLGSGTPEIGALGVQLTAATPWLAEKLRAISFHMKGGLVLPDALRAAGPATGDPSAASVKSGDAAARFQFPSLDIIEDIESLHGFADFPDRIERVAENWSEDIMARTRMLAKIFGLLGNLLTYGVIIFIILGCNDLQSSLSVSAGSMPH